MVKVKMKYTCTKIQYSISQFLSQKAEQCRHVGNYRCVFLFGPIMLIAAVTLTLQPASVAHLDAPSYWRPGGRGSNPRRGRQNSFVEIDHEIFSTVILSLPLIQEGQLSVSGERMCTILVNRLED